MKEQPLAQRLLREARIREMFLLMKFGAIAKVLKPGETDVIFPPEISPDEQEFLTLWFHIRGYVLLWHYETVEIFKLP